MAPVKKDKYFHPYYHSPLRLISNSPLKPRTAGDAESEPPSQNTHEGDSQHSVSDADIDQDNNSEYSLPPDQPVNRRLFQPPLQPHPAENRAARTDPHLNQQQLDRRLGLPPTYHPQQAMDLPTQLQTSLRTQSLPLPSLSFLTALSTARNPPPPLASLLATARSRILASDLTSPGLLDPSYVTSHSFPSQPEISSPNIPERKLASDTIVQILDIENLSKSRWEQVEELEAIARGEEKRGREIVRLPTAAGEDNDNENENGVGTGTQFPTQASAQHREREGNKDRNSTHKLLLQDCQGQTVYGIELKRVDRIGITTTFIGEKMLLKTGTVVARGTVMLEPATCFVLGGKVEAWNKAWLEGRLARLREVAEGGGH
ncbi:hypothetical protein QBC35DRAFT_243691 [Podospora australis]|uniref:RecQ mediated genome instability protein 1 N-terminal domain-containing protein n=1 Tax=Podospora australis TaxID=1536484 RepID=A0AAN7AN48_9PEZI|nr:hypothetical protein QBC35DRAFT_243691 [Podospora australis]